MIFFTQLTGAFLTALLVENLLFARAFDIPGLYDDRTPSGILKVGGILIFITLLSSVPAYFLNTLLKNHSAFVPFMTLSFLILNGIAFLLTYYGIKRFMPRLFCEVGDSLPFYGVNCVTLGSLLIAARLSDAMKFPSFIGYCLGCAVGFTVALLVLWSIRQKLSMADVPKAFRGLPITFIYLGIVSLALFGLLGNQLPA